MIPIQTAVPSRYPPLVTWLLIVTNSGVFLLLNDLDPSTLQQVLHDYALIPARYFIPTINGHLSPANVLPLFTMMFLHGSWLHLIFNMWMLWLFGPTVEDRLGHVRYLGFYLACGLAASVAHLALHPTSTVPVLGASGAIAGVLGCYMRLFPLARVIVLAPLIIIPLFFEVHAFVFIAIWFLVQVLQGTVELLLPAGGDGVAWWAHIGGFIAGFGIGPLLARSEQSYRPYYADEGILGFDTAGRR